MWFLILPELPSTAQTLENPTCWSTYEIPLEQIIWYCQWHMGIWGLPPSLCPERPLEMPRRRVDVIIGRPEGTVQGETGSSKSMALCRVFVLPCDRVPVRRDYLFCHSCHVYLSSDPSSQLWAVPASLSLSPSRSHAGKTSFPSLSYSSGSILD